MIRKLAVAALVAGWTLAVTSPAMAATPRLIGGQWVYLSLDFTALIEKLTGKDINDGTFVGATVKILTADTLCANPQTKLTNPGQGPKSIASGTSPNINDGNLTKDDRVKGTVFTTTAVISDVVPAATRLNPPEGTCKSSPGVGDWQPLYWQDRSCNKGTITGYQTNCYQDYAGFVNGTLTYINGAFAGYPVTINSALADWTYIYLPTSFKFKATLNNSTTGSAYSDIYGTCQFPLNPANGEAYSITNPPAGGWGSAVGYECVEITADQYNN